MSTNREMYTYHKEFELVHTLAVKVERGILKFHRIDPSTDGEGHVLRVKGKIAQVHSETSFVLIFKNHKEKLINPFVFKPEENFYYKVNLNRDRFTYNIFDTQTNQRVGTSSDNRIKFYQYFNSP